MLVTGTVMKKGRVNLRMKYGWTMVLIPLLIMVSLLVSLPVAAQGQEPTIEEINEVARDLWCPLCNGVRLDVCELRACDQMRDTISDQLKEGKSKTEIKDYFIEKYGVIVLGEPPRQGINLLPWLLPFIVLILGGGYLAYLGRRWTRRAQPASASAADKPSTASPSNDKFMRQVDEDLKRLD